MTEIENLEPLKSYCVACDAEPGKCDHKGPRYLDPVEYVRVEGGWSTPNAAEKHRFYNSPPAPKGSDPRTGIEPKPIQQIIVELEAWMLVETPLEAELRSAYDSDPRAVTLVAQSVISQVDSLHNPAGLLVTKLRGLAA